MQLGGVQQPLIIQACTLLYMQVLVIMKIILPDAQVVL
jgi:hypothetical protein